MPRKPDGRKALKDAENRLHLAAVSFGQASSLDPDARTELFAAAHAYTTARAVCHLSLPELAAMLPLWDARQWRDLFAMATRLGWTSTFNFEPSAGACPFKRAGRWQVPIAFIDELARAHGREGRELWAQASARLLRQAVLNMSPT